MKMKHIENIIIGVPLVSWTELITDGTNEDISVRIIAYILIEIGIQTVIENLIKS